MKIGILGSGRMGGRLGILFASLAHLVWFSYSGQRARAWQPARQLCGPVSGRHPIAASVHRGLPGDLYSVQIAELVSKFVCEWKRG